MWAGVVGFFPSTACRPLPQLGRSKENMEHDGDAISASNNYAGVGGHDDPQRAAEAELSAKRHGQGLGKGTALVPPSPIGFDSRTPATQSESERVLPLLDEAHWRAVDAALDRELEPDGAMLLEDLIQL